MALEVAIDQGINLKKLKPLQRQGIITLHQVRDIEQSWSYVKDHGQPFTIGVSYIGGQDMIADDNVEDVRREFGPDKKNDFLHLYSAYLAGMGYFITENTNDFIAKGKRERLESLTRMKIRTTKEFLSEIS